MKNEVRCPSLFSTAAALSFTWVFFLMKKKFPSLKIITAICPWDSWGRGCAAKNAGWWKTREDTEQGRSKRHVPGIIADKMADTNLWK